MRILLKLYFVLGFIPHSIPAPSLLAISKDIEKDPVGNHVASHFHHHCLTHVVDFSALSAFNYETSDAPRTLYNYPSHYLSNYTSHHELSKPNMNESWRMQRDIQKIQGFRCILTMVSVLQGTVNLKHAGIRLNSALSQKNVLGYSTSMLQQIMPEYFVIFSISDSNFGSTGSNSLESFTHGFVNRFFESQYAAHLPALFAVQIGLKDGGNRLKGFIYCWFCAEELEMSEFSCISEARCPVTMMETYLSILAQSRTDIQWIYFKQSKKVQPLGLSNFCPLTLGRNSSCLAAEIDIVGSFLTEGSNRSAVARIFSKETIWDRFPRLSYKRVEPGVHAAMVVPVGRSVQFRFITADGIQSDRASFASFSAPFSNNMWLALGCTGVFLAVCVAAMSSHSFVCALPRSIIEVAAPLLEKVTVDARVSRSASIMVTCWIFVAIVITTSYKSMMKSNYMIEQKYTTKWKSFREIENFTFIHAESIYDKFWLDLITEEFQKWRNNLNVCKTEATSYNQKCVQSHEYLFWQSYCLVLVSIDERFACEVFDLAWRAAYFCCMQHCPDNEKFKNWLRRRKSLLQNIARHSVVRPFSQIGRVIREEMLQPRTAFVSPAETFDGDWKIFEEESSALHVRFSYSQNSEDFGSMFGYQLTSGFNEHVGNAMHLRAEMLMESGIFWLWKQWEKLRRDFGNRITPGGKKFVELSFRNSDIHLTFAVYWIGILVALLFRGAEYLWFRGCP